MHKTRATRKFKIKELFVRERKFISSTMFPLVNWLVLIILIVVFDTSNTENIASKSSSQTIKSTTVPPTTSTITKTPPTTKEISTLSPQTTQTIKITKEAPITTPITPSKTTTPTKTTSTTQSSSTKTTTTTAKSSSTKTTTTTTQTSSTKTTTTTTKSSTATTTTTTNGPILWLDEFNYNGVPNSDEWYYQSHRSEQTELQCYSNSSKNVYVQNGTLVIKSLKESINSTCNYTSGRIISKKFFQYGVIEMRAIFPKVCQTLFSLKYYFFCSN